MEEELSGWEICEGGNIAINEGAKEGATETQQMAGLASVLVSRIQKRSQVQDSLTALVAGCVAGSGWAEALGRLTTQMPFYQAYEGRTGERHLSLPLKAPICNIPEKAPRGIVNSMYIPFHETCFAKEPNSQLDHHFRMKKDKAALRQEACLRLRKEVAKSRHPSTLAAAPVIRRKRPAASSIFMKKGKASGYTASTSGIGRTITMLDLDHANEQNASTATEEAETKPVKEVEVPKIEVTPAQEESIRNYINSYIMKGRPISSKRYDHIFQALRGTPTTKSKEVMIPIQASVMAHTGALCDAFIHLDIAKKKWEEVLIPQHWLKGEQLRSPSENHSVPEYSEPTTTTPTTEQVKKAKEVISPLATDNVIAVPAAPSEQPLEAPPVTQAAVTPSAVLPEKSPEPEPEDEEDQNDEEEDYGGAGLYDNAGF